MAFYKETKKAHPAFEMIGIEVQYSGTDVIRDHIDFYGMKYPIAERGSIDGYTGVVLPVEIVFNHKGELILHKRIFDDKVRQVILEALAAAPHPLLGDKEYKHLAREAQWVKSNKNLGEALARARTIWADHEAEPTLWDEAYTLFSRLDNHAESLLCNAELTAEENPVIGVRAYREINEMFAGDERGLQAKKAMEALVEHKNFKREHDAWVIWEKAAPIYEKHRLRITDQNRILLETVNTLCSGYRGTVAGDLAVNLKPQLVEALKARDPSFTGDG